MKALLTIILFVSNICLSQTQINVTDSLGKKQGLWIITGKMNSRAVSYLPNQIIEEGEYKNNKKIGLWKEYYPNGNQKSELNFDGGRPSGKMILFYENGCKKEEGNWKSNRWIGEYKAYNENEEITEQREFKIEGKVSGNISNCISLN